MRGSIQFSGAARSNPPSRNRSRPREHDTGTERSRCKEACEHEREPNNRWRHLLLVLVILSWPGRTSTSRSSGSVAYAVEKGVREADQEHLAKVEAISAGVSARRQAGQARGRPHHHHGQARRTAGRGRRPQIDPKSIPEPFKEFFEEFQDPRFMPPGPREGTGSGVIIDAEAGYVITNNHVVSDVEDGQGRIDVRLV